MADVGINALDTIFKSLFIDEEWAVKTERSFSWIAHRIQQTISASKIIEDDGILLSRLTANSVVVEDIEAPEAFVLRLLVKLNRQAIGSAYSFDSSARNICATAIAYVHDETVEWRPAQFGAIAITQLCLVESEADYIAEKCEGKVATVAHPKSGLRTTRDDMLNIVDSKFSLDGLSVSRFQNKFEFETIAELTMRTEKLASLGGSETGVAIEVAFENSTSLIQLSTEEQHRRIGSGLCMYLHLPTHFSPEEGDRIVATLNRAERDGSALATHYGAWCWGEWPKLNSTTIAYKSFLPNSLHRPGISQSMAFSMSRRAIWADGLLNAGRSEVSVWNTLKGRYGVSSNDE